VREKSVLTDHYIGRGAIRESLGLQEEDYVRENLILILIL